MNNHFPSLSPQIKSKLIQAVGKEYFNDTDEVCLCYGYDSSDETQGMPEAVIWPQNTKQVQEILKIAQENRLPIYPRGAGSNRTGGTVPSFGGLVLSMEKMRRIINIDPELRIAIVEPGVVVADLKKAVKEKGLFYPPEPASYKFSTIGGNVAENAGGLACVKYGTTKDYVLALEAVIPGGERIQFGTWIKKTVAGYNLVDLLVGSEGTLAVITKITLKLIIPPADTALMAAFCKTTNAGAQLVETILSYGVIPRAMEFLDQASINCAKESGGNDIPPIPENTEALLLIEVDGTQAQVDTDINIIKQITDNNNDISIIVANDNESREQLWAIRRAVSPALGKMRTYKVAEDVGVPPPRIPILLKALQDISHKFSVPIVCFGHAGDGNIHVSFLFNRDKSNFSDEPITELMKKVVELKGTITSEHGIGAAKARFLPLEIGAKELNIMKAIKKVFDPKGILNPGKIFLNR